MTASHLRNGAGKPLAALAGILVGWLMIRAVTFDLADILPDIAPGSIPSITSRFVEGNAQELEQMARATSYNPTDARSVFPSVRFNTRAFGPTKASQPSDSRIFFSSLREEEARGRDEALRIHGEQASPARNPLSTTEPGSAIPSPQAKLVIKTPWSLDAWLSLRPGASRRSISSAPVSPSYGGSQAGAILRYRLDEASPLNPQAYVRAVTALSDAREADLAVGLTVQPVKALPFTANAEARLSVRSGYEVLRPAVFIAGGFDAIPLPLGVRGRGYVQSGYVGGRDGTAFVDGNLVADREVVRSGGIRGSFGAGAWGGAQEGTGRLDVGPTLGVTFPLGNGFGRLELDYRYRAAGNAEPGQGVALTVSAGI